MTVADRVKGPLLALVKHALSRVDYYALYRARMVAQSADMTKLDVIPDDSRIPPMTGILLRHGVPGLKVQVAPGAFVLVGWSGGDPSRPYCQLWEGGETVLTETFSALNIKLGGPSSVQPLVLGTLYASLLNNLGIALEALGVSLTAAGNDPIMVSLMSQASTSLIGAGTAMNTAAVTFIAAIPGTLSTVVVTS